MVPYVHFGGGMAVARVVMVRVGHVFVVVQVGNMSNIAEKALSSMVQVVVTMAVVVVIVVLTAFGVPFVLKYGLFQLWAG